MRKSAKSVVITECLGWSSLRRIKHISARSGFRCRRSPSFPRKALARGEVLGSRDYAGKSKKGPPFGLPGIFEFFAYDAAARNTSPAGRFSEPLSKVAREADRDCVTHLLKV